MKKVALVAGLVFGMPMVFADESESTTDSHSSGATSQNNGSCVVVDTRFTTGIDHTRVGGWGKQIGTAAGDADVQNASLVDIDLVGPCFKLGIDVIWTNFVYFGLDAGATVGTTEQTPYTTIVDEPVMLRTRTYSWDLGAKFGGDFGFDNRRFGFRPWVGFGVRAFKSRNLSLSTPSLNYTLMQLTIYQPKVGFDVIVRGKDSSTKFGLGYIFPWTVYRGANPDEDDPGVGPDALLGPKNYCRAARMGLEFTGEFTYYCTSSMDLLAGVSLSTLYARGRNASPFIYEGGDSTHGFVAFYGRATSLKAYLGLKWGF